MPDGRIARYGKATARSGLGGELATKLLAAADELRDDPGCELYLINRQTGSPDVVWVTEVMAIVGDFEMIERDLLGGKGPS